MEGYQFKEAAPYLQRALAIVKLPDLYLALGIALHNVPDLNAAEAACRDGLAMLVREPDEKAQSDQSNELGQILLGKRGPGRSPAIH